MAGQVVQHDVDFPPCGFQRHQLSEEGDKLFSGMTRGSLAQYGPGAGIEGGKQRERSVPIILKAVSFGAPRRQRQDPIEAVERLGQAAAPMSSAIVWRPACPVEDLGFQRRSPLGHSPSTMTSKQTRQALFLKALLPALVSAWHTVHHPRAGSGRTPVSLTPAVRQSTTVGPDVPCLPHSAFSAVDFDVTSYRSINKLTGPSTARLLRLKINRQLLR